jgi:hypothetical protein
VVAVSSKKKVAAFDYQIRGGVLNPYYRYEVAAKVLRQIDLTLPSVDDNTVIFIELPDNQPSPLGWNYTTFHWSCVLFGVPAFQGRRTANGGYEQRVFGYPDSLYNPLPPAPRMIHYRVNAEGKTEYVGIIESPAADAKLCLHCVLHRQQRLPGNSPPFISRW